MVTRHVYNFDTITLVSPVPTCRIRGSYSSAGRTPCVALAAPWPSALSPHPLSIRPPATPTAISLNSQTAPSTDAGTDGQTREPTVILWLKFHFANIKNRAWGFTASIWPHEWHRRVGPCETMWPWCARLHPAGGRRRTSSAFRGFLKPFV